MAEVIAGESQKPCRIGALTEAPQVAGLIGNYGNESQTNRKSRAAEPLQRTDCKVPAKVGRMRLTANGLASERGGRPVFDDISFAIGDGDLFTVTGPNGAGKSTLLRIIAGLLPATAGEVVLDPEPDGPRGIEMHYLGHRDGLKSALSVRENIVFWRRTAGESGLTPMEALERVRLPHLIDLPAAFLSAGQKRRVAISRLLAVERPIWLLDEPTAALDAQSEAELGDIISEHIGAGGMVVAATHLKLPVAATQTIVLGADR
jgi:heme exporter protein A